MMFDLYETQNTKIDLNLKL